MGGGGAPTGESAIQRVGESASQGVGPPPRRPTPPHLTSPQVETMRQESALAAGIRRKLAHSSLVEWLDDNGLQASISEDQSWMALAPTYEGLASPNKIRKSQFQEHEKEVVRPGKGRAGRGLGGAGLGRGWAGAGPGRAGAGSGLATTTDFH